MQIVPIKNIPNQSFSIVLDNNQWGFIFRATNGVTSVTITLNNTIIIQNIRTVANQLIIPSQYQEAGNFLFLTQNFQLPDYTQFGITQLLVYISAAELVELRAPVALPIKPADFSPLAAPPLRFAPQGYIVGNLLSLEGNDGNILLEGGVNYILTEGSA